MNRSILCHARCLLVAILVGSTVSAGAAAASGTATELDKNIHRAVVDFGYSDQTADVVLVMVHTWPCSEMQQTLEQATQKLKQGKMSVSQYAGVEKATAERLAATIKKEIASAHLAVERSSECYDLADVAKTRRTHCLGYTQMFFILSGAIGLKVQGIQVEEHLAGSMPTNATHVACLVELRDGKALQVDLTARKAVSEEFRVRRALCQGGRGVEN